MSDSAIFRVSRRARLPAERSAPVARIQEA